MMLKRALFSSFLLFPLSTHAEKVLNVYNWVNYIDKSVITSFEEKTGIKVRYDFYDSNEILEAKIFSGNSGYDLVFPSANPTLRNHITADIYQKIDLTKLTNYKHLDPDILKQLKKHDRGLDYSIPYLWGSSVLAFIKEKIDPLIPNAPYHSWKLLFDPQYVSKLEKCHPAIMDSPSDVMPELINFLGRPPNKYDYKDLKVAEAALVKIRPYTRFVAAGNYINALANGDICISIAWSGDLFQAQKKAKLSKNGVKIDFSYPVEGSAVWMDVMAIPKDAPNAEGAHLFIDHLLDPQNAAKIVTATGYASPNTASKKFLSKELRENPLIFPPDDVKKRLYIEEPPPQRYERKRTRSWIRIKSGH